MASDGGRSLVGRVALAAALAATVGSAVTVLASSMVVERALTAREHDRLLEVGRDLAAEIAGQPEDAVAHEANEESRELERSGIRVAVLAAGRVVGGHAVAGPAAGPGCDRVDDASGQGHRRCTVAGPPYQVEVARATAADRDLFRLFVLAGGAGAVLAALLALALSRRTSRWAMAPLLGLGRDIAAVDAQAPGRAKLGQLSGCDEVDEIRRVLAALLERLDRALDQARRFAADAAHELRTPLTVLRGELELLAEDLNAGPPRDTVVRLGAQVASLSTLIERLLTLARPLGADAAAGEIVVLTDVVRDAHAALDPARRARVSVPAADELAVRGDATLLRTLCDNALDNALKYSDGPVAVTLETRGADVVLAVADRGPGIPAAARADVFRAFHRLPADRAGAPRGHGIGLALVAHIAAAHGGRAAFVDAEVGARLEVTLPCDVSRARSGS